jgi:hypothetical protein
MNRAIVEGMKAKIEAFTYKKDLAKADSLLAAKDKEIVRKEGVIVAQIEKNKICYTERDLHQMQMKPKDEIIGTQANTIKRLGSKPKYWTVSLGAGYIYALQQTVSRGFSVGVFVGRTIFKF